MVPHAPSAALELPRRRAPSLTRLCNAPGCQQPARRRGRKCNACSLRAWRNTHREADRAREGKRTFTDEQQLLRNARATIAMAIKRGSISVEPCQVCQTHGLPHHPDPRLKLEVLWLCREHRSLQRERETHIQQQLAQTQAATARVSALDLLRARFFAEWDHLAPEIQATIEAIAKTMPLGRMAPPGSPLAKQNLIHAFGAWLESPT